MTGTSACADNEIDWTLRMKNGDVVTVKQGVTFGAKTVVEYHWEDTPMNTAAELQALLTLPGAWFCAGCAMAALRIPAGQGLLVLAVLAAFVWLTAQLGLALGLCLPNLHWVSEAAVVKRSAASMLAMFGGWLLAGGVLFLPLILLDYAVPPLAAQTVCLAVLLGLDLLLHRWLCTRGAARFAALH